ncbi:formate acetyltransferase, partial [Candidatus Roizmanbacteria bacterium CG10_big_fil_rev_8_21_14_0_10_39_6]
MHTYTPVKTDFVRGPWTDTVDVHNFITCNAVTYNGDEQFLSSVTKRTKELWGKVSVLMTQEQKKGILDLDVSTPSTILSHKPGYIDKKNEIIVGLQTDKPLKRAIKPKGGIQLVQNAAKAYGFTIPRHIVDTYTRECTTHNDAVFSAYTPLQKLLRSKHIITGLPDNYGRGRIIGDYRRVPLYGTKKLIEERVRYLESDSATLDDDAIQLRREIFLQIQALRDMATMAKNYGYDISVPAKDSKEAVQWLYFAYLAAVKEQDGAAMSLGRIDAFLDCYFERDVKKGLYSEQEIQEILDDFVIKLRLVRHLRHPEYEALFAGDPTWVTLVLGGGTLRNKSLVTKTSFRFLHTLTTLGPAPEPNLTVLWGKTLPATWKNYCVSQSIATSSIQYENDVLMQKYFGDDYGVACCVSGMSIGKDMQYFGARANLAKVLLLAINGGREEPHGSEKGGDIIIPGMKSLSQQEYLSYDDVWKQFIYLLDWLAKNYVDTMNVIHYMHDRYN